MPFDPTTAKALSSPSSGFDPSTAKPFQPKNVYVDPTPQGEQGQKGYSQVIEMPEKTVTATPLPPTKESDIAKNKVAQDRALESMRQAPPSITAPNPQSAEMQQIAKGLEYLGPKEIQFGSEALASPVISGGTSLAKTALDVKKGEVVNAGIDALHTAFNTLLSIPTGANIAFNIGMKAAQQFIPKTSEGVLQPLSAAKKKIIAEDFKARYGREATDADIEHQWETFQKTPVPFAGMNAGQAFELGDVATNLMMLHALHETPAVKKYFSMNPSRPEESQEAYRQAKPAIEQASKEGSQIARTNDIAARQENVRESQAQSTPIIRGAQPPSEPAGVIPKPTTTPSEQDLMLRRAEIVKDLRQRNPTMSDADIQIIADKSIASAQAPSTSQIIRPSGVTGTQRKQTERVIPNAPTKTAEEQLLEQAGLKVAISPNPNDKSVWFTDPQTGSTLAIPKGKVTPESIQQKLASSRADFARPLGVPRPGNWEQGEPREFSFDPNSTKNEGRFRMLSPDAIKKDSYFRRKSSTPGVSFVMGIPEGEKKAVVQAVRFDKNKLTEDQARQWWNENKNRNDLQFSRAKSATTPTQATSAFNPATAKPVEQAPEVPKIVSAVAQVGDQQYEGASHEEALNKAGMSKKTSEEGKDWTPYFKTDDGRLITRDEAKKEFGITHSQEVPELKAKQDVQETPPFKQSEQAGEVNAQGQQPVAQTAGESPLKAFALQQPDADTFVSETVKRIIPKQLDAELSRLGYKGNGLDINDRLKKYYNDVRSSPTAGEGGGTKNFPQQGETGRFGNPKIPTQNKPTITPKESEFQRQMAKRDADIAEAKRLKKEGMSGEDPSAVNKEDIPQERIDDYQKLLDATGTGIRVVGPDGKNLSAPSIRKAIEEWQKDRGQERSYRAQALIAALDKALESGTVEIRPADGMPHEQVSVDRLVGEIEATKFNFGANAEPKTDITPEGTEQGNLFKGRNDPGYQAQVPKAPAQRPTLGTEGTPLFEKEKPTEPELPLEKNALRPAYRLSDGTIIPTTGTHGGLPEGTDVNKLADASTKAGFVDAKGKFLTRDEAAKEISKGNLPLLSVGGNLMAHSVIQGSNLSDEDKKKWGTLVDALSFAGIAVGLVAMSPKAKELLGDLRSSSVLKVARGEIDPKMIEHDVDKNIDGFLASGEAEDFSADELRSIQESKSSPEFKDESKKIADAPPIKEPPPQPEVKKTEDGGTKITGIKNAFVEQDRIKRGLEQITKPLSTSDRQLLDEAVRKVDSGELDMRQRVDDVIHGNGRWTEVDNAGATYQKMKLLMAMDDAQNALLTAIDKGDTDTENTIRVKMVQIKNFQNDMDFASTKAGYYQGRTLASRKPMIDQELNLVSDMNEIEAAYRGKEVPKDVMDKVTRANKMAKDVRLKQAQREEELFDQEVGRFVKKSIDRAKREPQPKDLNGEYSNLENQLSGATADQQKAIFKKMLRNRVQSGVNTVDGVVDAIYNSAVKKLPAIDKRSIRDSITGYGLEGRLTRSDITKQLSGLRQQMSLISKIEDVESGKRPFKKTAEGSEPVENTMRLRNQLTESLDRTGMGQEMKNEKSLKSMKARLNQKIEELVDRIKKGDFEESPQRPSTLNNKEIHQLQIQYKQLREVLYKLRDKAEYENQPQWKKNLMFIPRWSRFIKLSGIPTLAKLVSFGIEQIGAVDPIEQFAAIPFSRLRISESAPTEGALSIKDTGRQIAQQYRHFIHGWLDSDEWKDIFTGKETTIERVAGGPRDSMMEVGAEKNIPADWLEFYNRLHKSMKNPVRRAIFEPALERIGKWYVDHGYDLSDPENLMEIAKLAETKANEAIFMEDNKLVSEFRRFINRQEAKGTKAGAIISAASQTVLPIVKVPTNIVRRTIQYSPIGLMKGAWDSFLGEKFEDLTPHQKDAIMRNLKRGSIGTAIAGLGFYRGMNDDDQKSKTPSLQQQSFWERYLLHHPVFESYRLSYIIGKNYTAYVNKLRSNPFTAAAWEGAKELSDEVPFINLPADAWKSLSSPSGWGRLAGEEIRGMVAPPDVQKIARYGFPGIYKGDVDESGTPVIRTPKGFVDAVKAGFPGLRKSIPENIPFEKELYTGEFAYKIQSDKVKKEDFERAQRLGIIDEDGEPNKPLQTRLSMEPSQIAFSHFHPKQAIEAWQNLRGYQKQKLAEIFQSKIEKLDGSDVGMTDEELDKLEEEAEKYADQQFEADTLKPPIDLEDKYEEQYYKLMMEPAK